jgi:hypothetical protein
MSDPHGPATPARAPQAMRSLADLARRLDLDERLGPLGLPWVSAAVDQHGAAVRDALIDRRGQLPVVALAGYVDGVLDTAARHGWILDDHVDEAHASWPLLRLLAVCVLAASAK